MGNYSDVNFIKHLLAISEKFIDDQRLGPLNISLYYALFHTWNLSKFRNPISVSRSELMNASKIGSANTYTKCLKDLHNWGYIKYIPSHNPHQGSQIYMYNFNNTANNGSDISNNKSTNKTTEKSSSNASVTEVIPYINNSNKSNKQNNKNGHEHSREKNNAASFDSSTEFLSQYAEPKKEKLREKKKGKTGESKSSTPTIRQLESFFTTKQWPGIEAKKFFNHYSSNGWLVGGKTPMANWKASAENWMLNSENFKNGKTKNKNGSKPRPGDLQATTGKDYDEPL